MPTSASRNVYPQRKASMEFQYITGGMSDPQGKPKVYFDCHPLDQKRALPLISEDILSKVTCAIWYDPDPIELSDVETEDFLHLIDDMQLVVLAVTSRFLREPSRARDVVLPHALEQHIPVLPIMLETDLEFEFNEVCAPIQVVNRTVTDSTATPYDEVLKTYLNAILISDKLAARVRDAFDAYVFLSYRKKDRRHAQRLMHLIHENERYRDIAIWYDEYLVPGEGFNKAIRAAFDKSSIFALSVTPSLLEQGNYVMDVEYPLARDRRKAKPSDFDIVPVEMYEIKRKDPRTNRTKLSENYDDLPTVQDEHFTVELNAALVEALDRVAKSENDGTPQHLFFIGLAYLNGIDVLPNYRRALDLMTRAAQPDDLEKEPCIDATEKLVDMYVHGEGVDPDLRKALHWQEVVVRQRRDAYDRGHDPDEHKGLGTKYFKALMRLSDLQRDLDSKDEAIETAERALAFSDELAEEVGIREAERDRAVLLNRLGILHRGEGHVDQAERCFRQAIRSYERMAAEMGTERALRDLSIGYERLGDLARLRKDLRGALGNYGQAHAIREEAASADPHPQARRDLSAILTKLGNIYRDGKRLDNALAYYKQALKLDEVLAQEVRTPQSVDDHCISLSKVGDVHKGLGALDAAICCYEEALEGYDRLIKDSPSPRYRKNRAKCLGKLASACKHAGDRGRAARYYQETIEAWEAIREEYGDESAETLHALATSYYNDASFSRDKARMKQAAEIWKSLSTRDQCYQRYYDAAKKHQGS